MMSHHLNSMLEHFLMSSFRRNKTESTPQASPSKENNISGKPQANHSKPIVKMADDKSEILTPTANNEISINVPTPINEGKRNSLQNNGDLKHRELSPSPRVHRKSSHDIRLKGNQCLLDRPLKTTNILSKVETFDTLHSGAVDVSRIFFYYTLNARHVSGFYSFCKLKFNVVWMVENRKKLITRCTFVNLKGKFDNFLYFV